MTESMCCSLHRADHLTKKKKKRFFIEEIFPIGVLKKKSILCQQVFAYVLQYEQKTNIFAELIYDTSFTFDLTVDLI